MKGFLSGLVLFVMANAVWATEVDTVFTPTDTNGDLKTIKIGILDIPPLIEQTEGTIYQGTLVRILEEVANKNGWKIIFISGSEQEHLKSLEKKKIDFIFGLSESVKYAQELVFFDPGLPLSWGQLYVNQYQPDLSYKALSEMSIVAVRDSIQGRYFANSCESFGYICKIQWVDSNYEAFATLGKEQAEAAVVNRLFGEHSAAAFEVYPAYLRFNPYSMTFAAQAQRSDLLEEFKLAFQRWKGTHHARYQEILKQTMGINSLVEEYSAFNRFNVLLFIILGMGILLLLALFWIYQIKNKLQQEKLENQELGKQSFELNELLEGIAYGIERLDISGTILFSNRMAHQLLRYKQGELANVSILDIAVSSEEQLRLKAYLRTLVKDQPKTAPYYTQVVRKDGVVIDLRMDFEYKRNHIGDVEGFIVAISDITETRIMKEKILYQQVGRYKDAEKQANELLDAYHDLLVAATVFESTTEGILAIDLQGRICTVNPALEKMIGYPEEAVLGQPFGMLMATQHRKEFYPRLWKHLKKRGSWQGEIWNQHQSGKLLPCWLSINVVSDEKSEVTQYVALLNDITKRKQYEKQIWRQAHYDSLTDLPNRNLFHQRLEQAVEASKRQQLLFALMFIDLDRFKEVNDTLGHDAGDQLLKAATQRITECVQKHDTVARMGGDEFTVILPRIEIKAQAGRIAKDILQRLEQPFTLSGRQVHISGSVGIVIYPEHGMDSATLLKNADIAMYQVKMHGRANYCFYEPEGETKED